MDLNAFYNLKEMLCKSMNEIGKKKEMSAGDLETVHKLTDTIKNIDKIVMLEESGYSQAGDWDASIRGTYGRENSYAARGMHYVRGHYSRDEMGGYNGNSRRYSRDDGVYRMREDLEELMRNSRTEKERETLRRCMDLLENA